MTTIIPPPSKKQRREAVKLANAPVEAVPSKSAPNVVIQLRSSKDDSLIGPPIRLPADTDRAGLELLANQLQKAQKQADRRDDDEEEDDDEATPYAFHVSLPTSDNGTTNKILVSKDLQDVIQKNESSLSIEDILTVICEPEAIFKVRQVTRCSSTLSGEKPFGL